VTGTAPAVTAECKGAAMVEHESITSTELQPNTEVERLEPGRVMRAGDLSDDIIAEVIRMRTLGIALRKIVEWLEKTHKCRVSHETIRRWTKEVRLTHEHVTSERIVRLRGEQAHRLDALQRLAMEQAFVFAGTKIGLDAINQATNVSRAISMLMGANLPVRHDISMTVETEQDRALRAMLEQARLKAEQDRQRVIEAASADPTL
jgi:hypothetical protein